MSEAPRTPVIAVVGRKNSGKTTLLVAVAAELGRRGVRVASVKHGHHDASIDHEGTDSWRHFHEGGVEAVLFVTADRVGLVSRLQGEDADPATLIDRFYRGQGYDLVLVEGYKHGPFPKIEIHRKAAHESALYATSDPESAALFLAVVTDDAELVTACPVIAIDPSDPGGTHAAAVADLITDLLPKREDAG